MGTVNARPKPSLFALDGCHQFRVEFQRNGRFADAEKAKSSTMNRDLSPDSIVYVQARLPSHGLQGMLIGISHILLPEACEGKQRKDA